MKHTCFQMLTVILIALCTTHCNKKEDFSSFNGSLTGTVKDNNGTPLYGDLNSNDIIIRLLGENDNATTDIRVNGNGTFANLKLFPKNYQVWLEGPVVKSDTIAVDLAGGSGVVKDFMVTPLVLPKLTNATVAGTSVKADYVLMENAGSVIEKKEIYCSTVPFPTAATGSRTNIYFTTTVQLPAVAGNVSIDGLAAGKYYVRIGVKAKSSLLMNYSNQLEVTVP